MEKKKIIYIIIGIILIIFAFGLGYYLGFHFSTTNHTDNKTPSNAKYTLNIHRFFTNDENNEDDILFGLTDEIGTAIVSGYSSCSFYVYPPANGRVEVSLYEDPEFKTEWTDDSSDYYKIDYQIETFPENAISTKYITKVTIITKNKKSNTTGVDIKEDVYAKITGKYNYDYKEK